MYRIRKTSNKDQVLELHKKTFPMDEFDYTPDTQSWLVFDDKNNAVGFCTIRPVRTDKATVFLSRAGLLYSARGKGLHRRMITARLRWAKKNGYKYCITYTTLDNFTSFHNLQKAGFYLYYPDYRYAGKNCLYWCKEL